MEPRQPPTRGGRLGVKRKLGGLLALLVAASAAPGGEGAAPAILCGMGRVPCRSGARQALAWVGWGGGGASGLGGARTLECFVRRCECIRPVIKVAMGFDDKHGLGLRPAKRGIGKKTTLESGGYAFPAPKDVPAVHLALPTVPSVAPQAVLLVVATGIFLSVLGLGGSTENFASVSSWLTADIVLSNVPTCALCFGLPDLFAQLLEDKGREIDIRQVFSAALIGIVMNAVGFEMWLHYLEILFPSDIVGFGSGAHGMLLLLLKSLADSLVWGTASNTAVLMGKRMMAGDSWAGAADVWHSTIIDVTRTELKFWPVWQAINFCFVPKVAQVAFMSIGELTWNSFLCVKASRAGGASPH